MLLFEWTGQTKRVERVRKKWSSNNVGRKAAGYKASWFIFSRREEPAGGILSYAWKDKMLEMSDKSDAVLQNSCDLALALCFGQNWALAAFNELIKQKIDHKTLETGK